MELASGFNDQFNPFPGGYSPQQNTALNNSMASAAQNVNDVRGYAQSVTDQHNLDVQAQGPSSGYGTVGGYPSFGDPAAPGTYSPGNSGGLSSFSGQRLNPLGDIYGQPYAGYTPATQEQVSSYGPAAQTYADEHHSTYGYYPDNDYLSKHYEPYNSYGQPGAAPTQGTYGDPFATQPAYSAGTPSWATLTPDQASYVGQHVQAYGYEPASDFFVPGGGWDKYYGPQSRSTGETPMGPTAPAAPASPSFDDRFNSSFPAMQRSDAAPESWDHLNPDQSRYVLAHIQQYGYEPSSDFFMPGKQWDQYYGPQGSLEQHTDPAHNVWVTDNNLRDIGNTDFSSQNRNIWGAGTSAFDDYGQLFDGSTGDGSATGNYDAFKNTTYRDPWIASIPEKFRTNETVDAMKSLAQQRGWDPAALAAVIQMETQNSRIAGQKGISPDSLWNTLTETGQYHGLTQMGRGTFDDAGGRLNGLTYDEYKRATPAQQVATYGAWLDQGAKTPGSAADLVNGGIGSLPPEMQAAIMMGTQFGPNAKSWVSALGGGNMDVATATKQADELKPWTINAMRDALAAQMARWPQTQSPWPLQ